MNTLSLHNACAAPWGDELLHDIDIEMTGGSVLGIIGPNGAGKSSLLQLLSGQMSLSKGSLMLQGQPLADWGRLERARSIALLSQHSSLNFPYTVEEVILLGRTPHLSGSAADREIAEQVMAATDALDLRRRLYTQLSGGEKQRVQLARIIAQLWRPEDATARLLLLDEPNNALDPAHQQMVLELIRKLADEGTAVALVMHDFNLVAAVADQVMLLDEGRQAAHGTPQEVFTTAMFEQVFKVAVHIMPHPASGRPLVFPA